MFPIVEVVVDGGFDTFVYMKPTFTGMCSQWDSCYPAKYELDGGLRFAQQGWTLEESLPDSNQPRCVIGNGVCSLNLQLYWST